MEAARLEEGAALGALRGVAERVTEHDRGAHDDRLKRPANDESLDPATSGLSH